MRLDKLNAESVIHINAFTNVYIYTYIIKEHITYWNRFAKQYWRGNLFHAIHMAPRYIWNKFPTKGIGKAAARYNLYREEKSIETTFQTIELLDRVNRLFPGEIFSLRGSLYWHGKIGSRIRICINYCIWDAITMHVLSSMAVQWNRIWNNRMDEKLDPVILWDVITYPKHWLHSSLDEKRGASVWDRDWFFRCFH